MEMVQRVDNIQNMKLTQALKAVMIGMWSKFY